MSIVPKIYECIVCNLRQKPSDTLISGDYSLNRNLSIGAAKRCIVVPSLVGSLECTVKSIVLRILVCLVLPILALGVCSDAERIVKSLDNELYKCCKIGTRRITALINR